MHMELVTTGALASHDCLCFLTDAKGLAALRAEYPVLAPWLEEGVLPLDSETVLSLPLLIDGVQRTLFFMGLGVEMSPRVLHDACAVLGKALSAKKATSVLMHTATIAQLLEQPALCEAAYKGLNTGLYVYNTFQSQPKAAAPSHLFWYAGSNTVAEHLAAARIVTDGIDLARMLVDTPANLLKPVDLAQRVVDTFAGSPVEVSVYEPERIRELGMELFLAVARGSQAEPRLIVMRYNGAPESSDRIGLIGKGLTYDSGGYSIKPTDAMLTMKCDMAGSAAVIGAMHILAQRRPAVNVTAVVAACENMISGNAYLPGDILTSMNGLTVEITNTDAEGRLTLADAITYAIREEGATHLVDICTLTGACMIALGHEFAGVLTREDALWDTLHETSLETLDPVWRLPLTPAIEKMNRGKMADLQNSSGRLCGMETAGAFLGAFTEEKPWIHIDIAGTAYLDAPNDHRHAGATGFGVHLLADLVERF